MTSDLSPVLEVRRLTRKYGTFIAVDNLDLTVDRGEIVGLLGPNGAGKSTALSMILGLLPVTSGEIRLFGNKPNCDSLSVRRRIAYVPENQSLYDEMTALSYVTFFQNLYRTSCDATEIDQLFDQAGLGDWKDVRIGQFSMGMKRKLSLIRALSTEPSLIVLDEPAANLDPHGVVQVREMLTSQRDLGAAILVSSHLLPEVEHLADRVIIMHHGRSILEGTSSSITRGLRGSSQILVEVSGDVHEVVATLGSLPYVTSITRTDNLLTVQTEGNGDPRQDISQRIHATGAVILRMQQTNSTLEDVFLEITNTHAPLRSVS